MAHPPPSRASGPRRPPRATQDGASRRFERWLLGRIRKRRLPARIGNRRIYILPTRAGYVFGVLVFLLWLGAMNYSNSMGFALAFLLAALGLVAMHFTHANLLGTEVQQIDGAPVHAGQPAPIRVLLRHAGQRERPAIGLRWPRDIADEREPPRADLPAHGQVACTLTLPTHRRGWQPLPPLAVETTYPLGLFRAWTWLATDQRLLVYPALLSAPETVAQSLAPRSDAQSDDPSTNPGREDFESLRDYQRGDALHDIHWKRFPRQQAPVVKQFTEASDTRLWLDWDRVSGDDEARLSRLAWLVCRADEAGQSWGLRLPGTVLAPAGGSAHRHACLRALACYPQAIPS